MGTGCSSPGKGSGSGSDDDDRSRNVGKLAGPRAGRANNYAHIESQIAKLNSETNQFYNNEQQQYQYNNNNGQSAATIQNQMDELMIKTQEHNLKIMREDLKSDPDAFMLDNLLLSVQWLDNLDRATTAAKEFKQDVEKKTSERLGPHVHNGAIHGERRCFLVHGMGHVLAQNYTYKDKVSKRGQTPDDEDSDNETYYDQSSDDENDTEEEKRTFKCNSILPLDFIVTWENLEVHREHDWDSLKEYEYSAPKGMGEFARFCLEEPNDHNKIPKGYARLRCVDIPMSIRLGHDPVTGLAHSPGSLDDQYYSRASELTENFRSEVSEVGPESDVYDSGDDADSLKQLRNKMKNLASPKFGAKSNALPIPPGVTKKPQGVPTPGWKNPLPRKAGVLSKSEPNLPEVTVSPGTPTPSPGSTLTSTSPKKSSFRAGAGASISRTPIAPTPVHKRLSKSVPKLTSQGAPKTSSSAAYVTNSIMSDEVRKKWRQIEVKNLSSFPKLEREHKVSEPIHQSCFMPIKVEIDSDDEDHAKDKNAGSPTESEDDEDDDESEEESGRPRMTKFAPDTKSNKKRKKKHDDDDTDDDTRFDPRFYLNSSAVSYDFCSEFNGVGRHLGITKNVLSEAIVLGTTVRCSLPYPGGLGHKKTPRPEGPVSTRSSKILYTFTPSLHSKAWPQRAITKIAWSQKVRANKGPEILRWPPIHQVETLELAGCNVIPMGFRTVYSTQSDHLIQQLNWQVGFSNAENVLLNTFKSVHWRCYIMAALIFRAFIAPLGPLGIGLEHIRNILYEMCNKDFHRWAEEKPGNQLGYLLRILYESLADSDMKNFFVTDYNMLKNVPPENTKNVQANLKKVRDNLIIHCIYALRNLRPMRRDFYPFPNFQMLYKILTAKEAQDLIALGMQVAGISRNPDGGKKKKKNKKQKKGAGMGAHMLKEGEVVESRDLIGRVQLEDKELRKRRVKRAAFEAKEKRKRDEERKKAQAIKAKEALPQERRSSIDLGRNPEQRSSHLRLPLIFKFFIRHFIRMAWKSFEFLAYSQTAMYILHIENLCQILAEETNEEYFVEDFRREIRSLRQAMGPENMREYVRSKFPEFVQSQSPSPTALDEVTMLNLTNAPSANNWVLAAEQRERRLPPLPATGIPKAPSLRRIATPTQNFDMIRSMNSIPAALPEENSEEPDRHFEFDFDSLDILPIPRANSRRPHHRRHKFIQPPHFSQRPAILPGIKFTRAPGGPAIPPTLVL